METVDKIPFLNIMKFISNKYNVIMSDNFKLFFLKNMEPELRKYPSHIRIYKFYIYDNALLKSNEYLNIMQIYQKSICIQNALKKFLYRTWSK